MRALVTRPQGDAENVARLLRARGMDVRIEPLLEIVPVVGAIVDPHGVQAILATSANGVRALAAATPERGLPMLAVGDASARVARDLGFARVEGAGGDVDSLAALVKRRVSPAAGALLHVAGTVVAGDLAGQLAADGYDVRRIVLYEARAATAPSPGLIDALEQKSLDLALFFSPRTAATFATLMREASLTEACRPLTAYCLSAAVARVLDPLPWRRLRVAARPEQQALLALIDEDLDQAAARAREAGHQP